MENVQISPQLVNPQAFEVCRALSNEGYQAYIVGGCVRDLLLGLPPKDWDITTDATPEEVMRLFPKTLPTGLQHGTVTVCMGHGVENHFEVTTFRIEGEYTDGRRPEEVFFVLNVEQDLARRDLTINAIAYDPIAERLVDPYNGIMDLHEGIVRAVGNPGARFREDGLRIMRAARFAARFGYALDAETFNAMRDNIDTLKKVSKERIQDELCKILMTENPSFGLQLLERSGALAVACPYLCSRPPFLHFLPHQDDCCGALETRLAFLYANCTPTNAVQEELMNLKFSNKEIKRVIFLHQLLDRYNLFVQKNNDLAYKSFMAVVKNHSPDPWEYTFEQFIQLLEPLGFLAKEQFEQFEGVTVLTRREMVLNGDDLLAIGVKPGPDIKRILDDCYLEVLRNPEHNTKSFLLDYAAGC
jgi:tRNA nucleotidyltransferase (CCA-adding enzyme)